MISEKISTGISLVKTKTKEGLRVSKLKQNLLSQTLIDKGIKIHGSDYLYFEKNYEVLIEYEIKGYKNRRSKWKLKKEISLLFPDYLFERGRVIYKPFRSNFMKHKELNDAHFCDKENKDFIIKVSDGGKGFKIIKARSGNSFLVSEIEFCKKYKKGGALVSSFKEKIEIK